jgi:hypothetical protein
MNFIQNPIQSLKLRTFVDEIIGDLSVGLEIGDQVLNQIFVFVRH